MPDQIPFVYRYFRSKGFGRRMSLSMARYCCDPDQPLHPENTK